MRAFAVRSEAGAEAESRTDGRADARVEAVNDERMSLMLTRRFRRDVVVGWIRFPGVQRAEQNGSGVQQMGVRNPGGIG